jgi:hypothetical protein
MKKELIIQTEGLYVKKLFEDEYKRFSPRSYRNGESVGFMAGITVGFVAGIMFICFVLGVF